MHQELNDQIIQRIASQPSKSSFKQVKCIQTLTVHVYNLSVQCKQKNEEGVSHVTECGALKNVFLRSKQSFRPLKACFVTEKQSTGRRLGMYNVQSCILQYSIRKVSFCRLKTIVNFSGGLLQACIGLWAFQSSLQRGRQKLTFECEIYNLRLKK